MVLLLLTSLIIIPVLMGWGASVEKLTGRLTEGLAGTAFTGMMVLSILWAFTAFCMPLSGTVEIITVIAGLFFFFRFTACRQIRKYPAKEYILPVFTALVIIFCATFYPYILDHFGYYVPTVKWLTEYGLVKGVANLDLTLGQMSFWHIFQAGFSSFSDPFLRINAVVLLVYTLYIQEKRSWTHLIFIPVLLLFSQSPSPDLPVIVFSLVVISEILLRNPNKGMLFAFSAFIFAIKPTMIWVPLVTFFYALLMDRRNYLALLPGAAVILLFFIKNIYVFGYPVFPVPAGSPGISWQPNPQIMATSSRYAILKTYDMQYSYEQIRAFSGWEYVRNWLFLEGFKSWINKVFVLTLVFFTGYAIRKKEKIHTAILVSLWIKSILVLIFSAQYRFFIDVFFVVALVTCRNCCGRKMAAFLFSGMSTALIGILLVPGILQVFLPSFRLGNFMGKYEAGQWYKPSAYRYHRFNAYRIGNFKFNVSDGYPYSFDTPLPAVSESYLLEEAEAGIFPQMIDPGDAGKGFIWKKLNAEEQRQADSVVNAVRKSYRRPAD